MADAAGPNIEPTPALQARPDYIQGSIDAEKVHVHRGQGLRCSLAASFACCARCLSAACPNLRAGTTTPAAPFLSPPPALQLQLPLLPKPRFCRTNAERLRRRCGQDACQRSSLNSWHWCSCLVPCKLVFLAAGRPSRGTGATWSAASRLATRHRFPGCRHLGRPPSRRPLRTPRRPLSTPSPASCPSPARPRPASTACRYISGTMQSFTGSKAAFAPSPP